MTAATISPRLRNPQTTTDELIIEADRITRLATDGCSHARTVKYLLLAACDLAVLGKYEHNQAKRRLFAGSASKRRFRRVHQRANTLLKYEAKQLANGEHWPYPPECVTVAQRDDHDCRYATVLLEKAGKPFNASQIAETAMIRRRKLFGTKTATRPTVEAVHRAVLRQIARDQVIRRYGGRAIWMKAPLDAAKRRAENWIDHISVSAVDHPDTYFSGRPLS